jgi:hypothetical protein
MAVPSRAKILHFEILFSNYTSNLEFTDCAADLYQPDIIRDFFVSYIKLIINYRTLSFSGLG